MKKKLLIPLIILGLLFLAGALFFMARPLILNHRLSSEQTETIIEIPQGYGITAIAGLLEREKVIDSASLFILAARLNRQAGSLKAGEYVLSPHLSNRQILEVLTKGKVRLHQVVIPEGFNFAQIKARLTSLGVIDMAKADDLFADQEFMAELGLEAPSLEGFLFPDTYLLPKGLKARQVFTLMVKRFMNKWNELTQNGDVSSLSRLKLVTLASIIEEEARLPEERKLISGVYHNRLRKGMRLQADPTVIYGIPDFEGPLTKKDLEYPSPFNTYLHKGLPPGPICSPGQASLAAALNPAKTKSIYFVAKGDGSHYFSKSYREHRKAVRKLRRLKKNH